MIDDTRPVYDKCVSVRMSCLSDTYVVYQYCGEVTVKFSDNEFFSKVKNSLVDKYPTLRLQLTSLSGPCKPQYITDQCGHDVSLLIDDRGRSVIACDDGAMSWVMRDFQTICRNVATIAGTNTCRPRQ